MKTISILISKILANALDPIVKNEESIENNSDLVRLALAKYLKEDLLFLKKLKEMK